MATSGTSTFNSTRAELLNRSLRICGVFGPNATPTTQWLSAASEAQNTLIKMLQDKGVFLWTRERVSQLLVVDQAEYDLDDKYESIDRADIIEDDVEERMTPINYDTYLDIQEKANTGKPNRFTFTQPLASKKIYVYPTPDTALTINYMAIKLLEDMTDNSNTADFPSKWLNVIAFGTAWILSPEAQLVESRISKLESMYNKFLAMAIDGRSEVETMIIDGAFD